jgi:hypothetical protein
MGNYCVSGRQKKEGLACIECNAVLSDEAICDVCLSLELKHLENLQYIHSYGDLAS